MNEVFLDTETTGLSSKDGDRILEIACIETKDLIPTKKIFHKLINPERKVSQEAFKVHGFSNDFLQDKQKFKDIAEELLEFIDGKKLIIHNAPFDIGFLNSELIIFFLSFSVDLSLYVRIFWGFISYFSKIILDFCLFSTIKISNSLKTWIDLNVISSRLPIGEGII